MSEKSPGTWVAPQAEAELKVDALDDASMTEAILTLHDFCASSFGPKGRLKVIHNNLGGHVTVTSSCNRLINAMVFSNPIVKLIISAVNGHLQRFHDGGLFVIVLATSLIKTSLVSSVPRHLMTEIYEILLRYGMDILNGRFNCKKDMDFASSEDPRALIRSILSTKVGCCLFGDDLEFLTTLIFRAFLSVCPRGDGLEYGTIIYMSSEGLPLRESMLYEGTLIDVPSILPYKAKDWKLLNPSQGHQIPVALFSMSLSGNSEESADADYDIEEFVDVAEVMMSCIKSLMEHLVKKDVRLVCCQRVIHPQIKVYLRSKRVTVLDRLGKSSIQHLKQVTGGHLIGSLSQGFNEGSLGSLDEISAVVINQQTFLHLKPVKAQVSTLLLGHRTEEALEELKVTCVKCEEVLKISLNDSRVLFGGGCWQTVLIAAIKAKVRENKENIQSMLDCTSHQLQSTVDNFSHSLKSTISVLNRNISHMTDTANHHHWTMVNCNKDCDWSVYPESCECGAIVKTSGTELQFFNEKLDTCYADSDCSINKPKVLDSFPAMVNAFQTAVSVANLVMVIENIIVDKN